VLHEGIPEHWASLEAEITQRVHAAGLPAPATDGVVEVDGRPGVRRASLAFLASNLTTVVVEPVHRRAMIRTQIRLTARQAAALKRVAHERHVSMASVIRDAVDSVIDEADHDAKVERAIAAIGGFVDGEPDAAFNHDRYLEDAWGT
jgi:hypothetical protein